MPKTQPHSEKNSRTAGGARPILTYTGKGATSRRDITVQLYERAPGSGISFSVLNPRDESASEYVDIPAVADSVVNTLRNVTLGADRVRICIVEHLLAAVSLWGLEDLQVVIDGPELPLGDGSARFWIELLQKSTAPQKTALPAVTLPEPLVISKGDRTLMAVPDTQFSVTYLMDWNHKLIGKKWQSWNIDQPITDVSDARTFGTLAEHQMLGLAEDAVSLTDTGFSHTLRFDDEPVRHKLLDLIGDLALIGINPLRLKARFISIKGGHELDVQLAKQLRQMLR